MNFKRFLRITRIIVFMMLNSIQFTAKGVVFSFPPPRTRGIVRISLSRSRNISIGNKVIINSGKKWNAVGLGVQTSLMTIGNGSIQIGNNVGISNSTIVSMSSVKIADNVMIGNGVAIYDTDFHSINYCSRIKKIDNDIKTKPVKICEGSFIGAGAIILKGVTIGKCAVVGAGAVVTKCIPAFEIWAGNPAKFIKKIVKEENDCKKH